MKWHVNHILGVSSICSMICIFVMRQCEGCIDAIKCCVGEFSSVSKCVGPIWMAKCLSQEGTAHPDKYHPVQNWALAKVSWDAIQRKWKTLSHCGLCIEEMAFYESFPTCNLLIVRHVPKLCGGGVKCLSGARATRRCPSSDSQALSRDEHCSHFNFTQLLNC